MKKCHSRLTLFAAGICYAALSVSAQPDNFTPGAPPASLPSANNKILSDADRAALAAKRSQMEQLELEIYRMRKVII